MSVSLNQVGQLERQTQIRVVKLLRDRLHYDYLGNWEKDRDNSNVEADILRLWLAKRGTNAAHIERALAELTRAANDPSLSIYDRNKKVYSLLRYGAKFKPEVGENTVTVALVDWTNPANNHFAFAEEVTVASRSHGGHGKRPDIVIYVNGIALGVLELKRSKVGVEEGIAQNLDNQKPMFIEDFFATMQLVMAGNDTQGLRYGTIQTGEKYYLSWPESTHESEANPLDRALLQMLEPSRLLEIIHDYIVFDAGQKKLPRAHQYFGVKAAQKYVERREGGIIWHTQGSGKSLSMVWLARWISENVDDARVLLLTDRLELDEQIEKVFLGVGEEITRAKSGADLIGQLGQANPWLICSLIHKFGAHGAVTDDDEEASAEDVAKYVAELEAARGAGWAPRGEIFVFVDECHRTQSGVLHEAMKALLPNATFIGFTGTPLLAKDKKKSLEVFGPYIHTYKFDEAVRDKVVLDLRYEARDVEQLLGSEKKIDEYFERKSKGLTDLARAQLKQRWGTLRKVLSSQGRLEKIAGDIEWDMETKPRLMSGHGNALLVAGSIYQACKYYEIFQKTPLKGKCAIVTSYKPHASDVKGSGTQLTEALTQYEIYGDMLADWFRVDKADAVKRIEEFEKAVKAKFIDDPAQMKLLIVVDKLLTGFDAPAATYLYIDKKMRDHGLFQAICRVNRLDGATKDYGYIVDYRDLFGSLQSSVETYTGDAFDGYDEADVSGLLENRLLKGRERLEEILLIVQALCEMVEPPRDTPAYLRYFCKVGATDWETLAANAPKRLTLYKSVAALVRAYANIADELSEAGYSDAQIADLSEQIKHYSSVRDEVKRASGDAIDLRTYEADMRALIDKYVKAEDSESLTSFGDLSLVQLLVERGPDAVATLPGVGKGEGAIAETIANNVRSLIIDEAPLNPKYYEKMSELLDAILEQRAQEAIDYREYLAQVEELARKCLNPSGGKDYPAGLTSALSRSLYDNLGEDEALALSVEAAARKAAQDDWSGNAVKTRFVCNAIKKALGAQGELTDEILGIVSKQDEAH